MKKTLIEIKHQQLNDRGNGTIYANLLDAKDESTLLSADLNYILKTAKAKGYTIVNLQTQLEYVAENFSMRI